MTVKGFALTILAFLLSLSCSDHGQSENDFPTRSVTVNGAIYKYRIFVPEKLDPAAKVPVMLYLHGSGGRGDDNSSHLGDWPSIINDQRERMRFVIVFPQCRQGTFWAGQMLEQAIAALDQTVKEFNGDENRLYLVGFSMGAFGTWQAAITHPNKFSALVPVAGGIEPLGQVRAEDKALLSPQVTAAASSQDPYKAYAEALIKTPVWVVHGASDEAVPVEASRRIVAAMRTANARDVNYIELEGVGHMSIGKALRDPRLYDWLQKQQLSAK